MRTKLLALLLVVLAPACVLLDLFPEGDGQGTGGPGGTGTGGAGTGGEATTTASSSSSAGGGQPGVAVEAVFGASPEAGVTSLRFLDVAVSGEQVAVVGHMLATAPNLSIGLAPCSSMTGFTNAVFVARFDEAGSCQTVHFYDAAELGTSVTGSIAFLGTDPAATDVVVAVSGANRSRVSRIDPAGTEALSSETSVGAVVVTDLVACGLDVLAGGAISAPSPGNCFPNQFFSPDTDAWVAKLADGTSCFPDALEHSEGSGFEQRVVSVACDGDRRGVVTQTLGDMTVGSTPVDADSSAAFFQAIGGRPELTVLGDFTCVSSSAAPRLLLDAGGGDWMFGADCYEVWVWHRPALARWNQPNAVSPRPNVFDRPSIALGPGFLFFGGEYESSRAEAPWPSPVRTGVLGAVDGAGNVLLPRQANLWASQGGSGRCPSA